MEASFKINLTEFHLLCLSNFKSVTADDIGKIERITMESTYATDLQITQAVFESELHTEISYSTSVPVWIQWR